MKNTPSLTSKGRQEHAKQCNNSTAIQSHHHCLEVKPFQGLGLFTKRRGLFLGLPSESLSWSVFSHWVPKYRSLYPFRNANLIPFRINSTGADSVPFLSLLKKAAEYSQGMVANKHFICSTWDRTIAQLKRKQTRLLEHYRCVP